MKNFTIALSVLLAMAIKTNAQITNAGFENWTTVGSYENPTGWATMNDWSAGPFYCCTKSTEHYPVSVGNYSIRLENNTSLTQQTGAYGMAITKAFDYPFKPAFPIIGHPNSLTGYFKFDSQNFDTLFIRIVLFKDGLKVSTSTFKPEVLTTSWTSFNLPLVTYTDADSATIQLSAFYPSNPSDGPKGNSVLYVDNLSFDNLITSVNEQASINNQFSLFPNPATNWVTLNMDNAKKSDVTLNIYNVVSTLVKTTSLNPNQQQFNIEELKDGVYVVEIKSNGIIGRKKLLIQR